jgi:membrane-associated protease RseP (regulator of RpoE activity)
MAPPIPPEASREIEFVKGLVAKHFPVYDVRVTYDVVEFFCRIDDVTLEDEFEKMRQEMGQNGYIPMIVYDKGEHIVTVAKKPLTKYRSIYVNLALLIITFFTVLLAGAISWVGYDDGTSDDIFAYDALLMGLLTFALPLMSILGVHELAHYVAARRRNVAASLPFFIFGPPPLGTFGAFISLRDPIPNKKALLEIGIAGPIAGLLMALPLGFLGLILTNDMAKPVPINVGSAGVIGVNFPLLYSWMSELVPLQGDYLLHPLAFAAWVGFLVTALNLLPFGQLDGGHVARALLGARSKYLGYATIAILLGIGMTYYFGWLLFALFVFILGARHPPPLNDLSPLGKKRMIAGALTFVLLVVAFVPIPMEPIEADYSFELEPIGDVNATIPLGTSLAMSFLVDNVGNAWNEIVLTEGEPSSVEWSASFKLHDRVEYVGNLTVALNASETSRVDVLITTGFSMDIGQNYTLAVKGTSANSTKVVRMVSYNISVASPTFTFFVGYVSSTVTPGNSTYANILFNNTGTSDLGLTLEPSAGLPQFVDVLLNSGGYNSTDPVNITIAPQGSWPVGVWIIVSEFCPLGEKVIGIEVSREGSLLAILHITIEVV